ncbi:hypothetical protein Hypma_002462 [Hypsizygus marmoreus]|uniref:Uncharacterized protein n=1 Tax=Hypsizygus marmoreus TaxID=39966 RepID=A0A369J8T7_HYPMA|nr:hypothetical protein Hypma_002462 [Hypsizygus marmoreus]
MAVTFEMLGIITADDLLPLVGSPAFIPAGISYIRNSSPGTLPLEPAIFQAVLLCVIAGDKHLILHTPEEDVGLVVRLAVWILSSIFDLPTQRVKMKLRHTPTPRSAATAPPPDPSIFLRSLFLHLNHNETFEQSRPLSRSRSKKSTRSDYRRSPSFANDLTSLAKSSSLTSRANPSAEHHIESSTSDTTLDVRQANTTFPIASPIPRPFLDAHLEPGPVRHDPTQPEFPHAIVMSGLEHASVQEQRSLARVLAERQAILEPLSSEEGLNVSERHEKLDFDGTWNVPEGFIAVYVSPWNARERPNIHKTLLDQFAMSSNIFVQQNVRQALRTLSFLNPITHTRLHSHSHSNPPTPSPLQAMPLPQSRTPPMNARTVPGRAQPRHSQSAAPPLVPKQLLPKTFLRSLQVAAQRTHLSPTLSLYLADLFSAARHHPQLDGTFLTARAMNDAEALVRAERVIGTDPTGGELLRHHDAQLSYDESIENDMGQKSLHDYDDIGSGSITLNIAQDVALIHPSTSDVHQHAPTEVPENVVPNLYVSEADIARIVPRVVTHRLRVRDGPEDEVLGSAMFGATFDAANVVAVGDGDAGHGWDTRSTVKDILIEILAEV